MARRPAAGGSKFSPPRFLRPAATAPARPTRAQPTASTSTSTEFAQASSSPLLLFLNRRRRMAAALRTPPILRGSSSDLFCLLPAPPLCCRDEVSREPVRHRFHGRAQPPGQLHRLLGAAADGGKRSARLGVLLMMSAAAALRGASTPIIRSIVVGHIPHAQQSSAAAAQQGRFPLKAHMLDLSSSSLPHVVCLCRLSTPVATGRHRPLRLPSLHQALPGLQAPHSVPQHPQLDCLGRVRAHYYHAQRCWWPAGDRMPSLAAAATRE